MTGRQPVAAPGDELARADRLLASFGIHVGPEFRTRRRELAANLPPWVDDLVLERLFREADVRGRRNAAAWVAGVLADPVELSFVERLRPTGDQPRALVAHSFEPAQGDPSACLACGGPRELHP